MEQGRFSHTLYVSMCVYVCMYTSKLATKIKTLQNAHAWHSQKPSYVSSTNTNKVWYCQESYGDCVHTYTMRHMLYQNKNIRRSDHYMYITTYIQTYMRTFSRVQTIECRFFVFVYIFSFTINGVRHFRAECKPIHSKCAPYTATIRCACTVIYTNGSCIDVLCQMLRQSVDA